MRNLVLIHTLPPLVKVFDRLCLKILPGVQVIHILDEPLLKLVQQRGDLAQEDAERLQAHVTIAEKINAGIVLVTCSTISPLVDAVRSKVTIPVLKIDDAMITDAIRRGSRIGVVATAATTLEPTRQALENQAEIVHKKIQVRMVLAENALQSLMNGNTDLHDENVKDAVMRLSKEVDLIVLAQASMARVLNVIPESERTVPILSSPYLALKEVKKFI